MLAKASPATLRQLLRLREEFGPEAARRKIALIEDTASRELATAAQVERFHELLCFWRAYPDNARLLGTVARVLRRFATRSDVQRVRRDLINSGIHGTDIVYPFGIWTARWLQRKWGASLSVEWEDLDDRDRLLRMLILYSLPAEVPGLDDAPLPPVEWLDHLRSPKGTAASWVVERASSLQAGAWIRDRLFDELDLPVRLAAGRTTPNRTLARFEPARVTYQDGPMRKDRPDLLRELQRPPLSILPVSPRDAARLIDLAHESMVTRKRDLDAFAWADVRDVRLVDCGEGLQFALIGVVPERRFVLESVYGLLTLKNGVPIGYALASGLFGSSDVAYNVFETFRGGEAAHVFGRLLATVRALFGSDTFSIDSYQLGGHGNDEGLDSGAWWFYYKLGFRPRAKAILPVVAREIARVARDVSYRTPRSTLEKLVEHNLFLSAGRRRDDVMGVLALRMLGLAVSEKVSRRFGSDREAAARVLAKEVGDALGARDWRTWPRAERQAWINWAPICALLPGLHRWTRADRHSLVKVIQAKGGRRESAFVPLFDRHRRLREAIVAICRRDQRSLR